MNLGAFPVSQGLEPDAQGHPLALGCLPVACPLPRRHPEPHNGSGWVFYRGSPPVALRLFHTCIMWLQIILDKGATWVFNVATLNKEIAMTKTKETTRKILEAIAECDRFIAKEEPRRADLRPVEVARILEHAKTHKAKLIGMLAE